MSEKQQTITHIVFDLDGTLIDTELWGLNNANRILSKFGKHCSIEDYSKLIGLDTHDRAQHLIDQFELDGYNKLTFREEWVKECMKSLTDIELMPGVVPVLEYFKKQNIQMAIATAGAKIESFAKTNHLLDVFEEGKYFKHIIHGDDQRLQKPKPHPDIYELCISEFESKPEPKSVLAFEDNSVGVSAAIGAGLTTILVKDNRFSNNKEIEANHIINGLNEFKPELFGLPSF